MRKTDHTIKPELKDKYEVVTPVPKLNLPELIENACVISRVLHPHKSSSKIH